MDILGCASASLIETIGLLGLHRIRTSPSDALSMGFILFLVQYAVVKIYRVFVYPWFLSPLRHLPGPKDGNLFAGQAYNIFTCRNPAELFTQWSREFPEAPLIRYLEFGNKEAIMVNSPDACKDLLLRNGYTTAKPTHFSRLLYDLARRGLLIAEGQEHKRQRHLLAGPLSAPNVRKITPSFRKKAGQLTKHLNAEIAASPDGSVQVQSAFIKATIDTIGFTVLGVELEQLAANGSSMTFYDAYTRMLHQSPLSTIITVIEGMAPFRIRRFIPLEASTGYTRASLAAEQMVRSVVHKRVGEVRRRQEKMTKSDGDEEFESRDILTFMMEERSSGEDSFTEEEILGQLLNFMAAGFEPTSSGLTWSAFVLAREPQVQEKLRAEAIKFLAQTPNPSATDYEKFGALNNFVNELLRRYPPSLILFREALEDITIAGVTIPKGTAINICPSIVNRSKALWGADADAFRPERWEGLSNSGQPCANAYAFQTFINGPHICIGKHFALQELRVFLVELVTNFRLSPSPRQDLGPEPEAQTTTFLLRAKHGLWIKIEKI